jgi:hypothetical protein
MVALEAAESPVAKKAAGTPKRRRARGLTRPRGQLRPVSRIGSLPVNRIPGRDALIACFFVDDIPKRLTFQEPMQVLNEEFHVQLVEVRSVIGTMWRQQKVLQAI